MVLPKLFVGRLPSDITDHEVRYIFQTYGPVKDVIIHGKEGRDGNKAAFVVYETAHAATTAIQVLSGVYKFRHNSNDAIMVSFAKDSGRDRENDANGDRRDRSRSRERTVATTEPTTTAYSTAPGYGYPAAQPYGGYGCYGAGAAYGYGYGYPPAGATAAPGAQGYGMPTSAGYGQPLDANGGGNGEGGTKLYVANLPKDITKDMIDYVFKNYGRVEDIFIMTGRSTNGQAAAFVKFTNVEEARNCVAAMRTGYEIKPGDGHLQVRYADAESRKRVRE